MSTFPIGLEALRESVEKAASRSQPSGGGKSLRFLTWAPNEAKVIRFLTDDYLAAELYDFIVDNQGNGIRSFLVDKDDPDRLMRYVASSPGIGWQKEYMKTDLRLPVSRVRGAGMAVVREEMREGRRSVVKDLVVEHETQDGAIEKGLQFGLVLLDINKFWKTMESFANRYGTITDRDYEVKRVGEGRDTSYTVVPLEVEPELSVPEKVRARYGYGKPWNSEDSDRFYSCPMTMQEWAQTMSSKERHDFFLTPLDKGETVTTDPWAADDDAPSEEAQTFRSIQDTLLSRSRG